MACETNPSLSTIKDMVEFVDESLKGERVGIEICSGVQVGDLPFVLFGLDDTDTTSSASPSSVVLSLSSGLLLSPELTLPASSGSLLLLVVTLALSASSSASSSSTLMSIPRTFLTHFLKKAANFFGLMMYKGGLAL